MLRSIAVDHGNYKIKTEHHIFTSGLSLSNTKPGFGETIEWEGIYYSLSENRIRNKWDKTEDDQYFVLTLFAIAKELLHSGEYIPFLNSEISLVVGLPPAHYGRLRDRFANYFTGRNVIKFCYMDKNFSITINEVSVYPQAYAAAVLHFEVIEKMPKAFVIDIGGYTVDYLVLRNGEPNIDETDSLDRGIITLYNKIVSSVSNEFGVKLKEADIDVILESDTVSLLPEVINYINNLTAEYIGGLLSELLELGVDFRTGKPIFVGGGSMKLKNFITKAINSHNPTFIEDIKANLKGYKMLFEVERESEHEES